MAAKILVVDPNEAFATMLRGMLEMEGGYETMVVHSGSDALTQLRRSNFDLTIVDMDLDPEDMSYQELISNVRLTEPTMRLMLIPLMGQALPSEAHQLNIQGALSKPFFADDLLPGIEDALSKQVSLQAPLPTDSPPPPPPPAGRADKEYEAATDIQAVLSELAREINGEAVLLVSTQEGNAQVIAHVSNLKEDSAQTLADLSLATVQAAQAAARSVGQPDRPFDHNMFESDTTRLYLMVLQEEVLFVAITPISTPLGTIRHNLRRSVRDLTALASA